MFSALFYDTVSSWIEQQSIGKQFDAIKESDDEVEKQRLTDASTLALWTSQDAANALMLIADYSLKRFRHHAHIQTKRWKALGKDARPGTKFTSAISAFAAQARHLHSWRPYQEEQAVFDSLGQDPQHTHSAAAFLQSVNMTSYDDFEACLLAVAHDALLGRGWRLENRESRFVLVREPARHGGDTTVTKTRRL
jgi:hypothetical protein